MLFYINRSPFVLLGQAKIPIGTRTIIIVLIYTYNTAIKYINPIANILYVSILDKLTVLLNLSKTSGLYSSKVSVDTYKTTPNVYTIDPTIAITMKTKEKVFNNA